MSSPANQDTAEVDTYFAKLTDQEVGAMLASSAKQLRFGSAERRELHRRIVQACLDALAERGRV